MSDAVMASSPPESDPDAGVTERVTSYRRVREQVERSILPLATSVDGYAFGFQASLHDLRLRRGGYVLLEAGDGRRLGQITDVETASEASNGEDGPGGGSVVIRLARGAGIVLDTDGGPFHDALVRPAEPDEVASWLARTRPNRAGLAIGDLLLAPGVPAVLDSGGLARHTFMCGQSGSGKTYSLGLLLERVLAETSLRVVILDANSDYVGLPRPRDGADPELAARYAHVPGEVAVWRNDPAADHPLRMRFADLEPAAQAAALGLDPIRDRDEYAVLTDLLRVQEDGTAAGDRTAAAAGGRDARSAPAGHARHQPRGAGVEGLGPTLPSLVRELRNPTARCTVVDLGSLDTMQEQHLVASAVLSTLWEERLSRQPCLIVIDEAHNICPADPADEMSRLSSDRAVQIAAEGRKYGLYLLTSTQRPNKVHENVVSQCDNLLLMRMNSQADLG